MDVHLGQNWYCNRIQGKAWNPQVASQEDVNELPWQVAVVNSKFRVC